MNFSWKRFLAMVLAVVMVVGMVPTHALHVHAEETEQTSTEGTTGETTEGTEGEPSAQAELTLPKGEEPEQIAGDGKIWVKDGNAFIDCGNSYEHTHGNSCYYLNCDHKEGHLNSCYAGSTSYGVCPGESDTHTHSGTSELGDVFGWNGSSFNWHEDHPAYPAVRAVYDQAIADWKAANPKGKWELSIIWEARAILAVYNDVMKDLVVCYTIPEGAVAECGHVHSELGGSCYGKLCILNEHTHIDPDCYKQNWKEVADVNNNEQADESEYYVVKFVDEDGTVLQNNTLLLNAVPVYNGEIPTKAGNAQFSYVFAGWDKEIVAAVADAVYTATYTQSVNEYVVTFVNYDGTVLQSSAVAYGETPAYTGATPTKPADDSVYSFAGWDPEINAVTGEVTYVAQFAAAECVAKIGEVGYDSLEEAIANVKNGETILLMADCAEKVTIKQQANVSFTIEGAAQSDAARSGERVTYTGTITINGNKRSTGAETLTIKNIDFVAENKNQISIDTDKSTYVHNVTVENCSFTGKEEGKDTAYGMVLRHAYNIVVKDTEGTDLFDLVYGNAAVTGLTVENVEVTDSVQAVFMAYVNSTATFKDLTVTNTNVGVGFKNTTKGTAVFENCSIEARDPVKVSLTTAAAFNVKFVGNNTFSGENGNWLVVTRDEGMEAVVTVDLSEDATLHIEKVAIPEGYCVKNAEADKVYTIQVGTNAAKIVRENSTQYFDTLAEAVAAVQNGETIIVLADLSEDVTITQKKNVAFTIDGNGKTYYGTMTVTNGSANTTSGLTINNVNFVVDGYGIYSYEKKLAYNIIVDDCTFTGTEGDNLDYGMYLRYVNNVIVQNTTGTKLFDLVYGNSSFTGFTAENVTVEDCTNGIVLSYVNSTATFKNVTTDADESGVLIRNNTAGSVYFEECNIDNVKYWQVENGKSVKMFFNDATNKLEISNTAEMLTVVLNNENATVEAIDGLNVITTDALVAQNYKVVYENGENGENGVWMVLKAHTVTFLDENGNELSKDEVLNGKMPQAPELTKENYVATWNPEIVEATGDATYTLVWVPENDVNTNGVADEEETVTVVVNKFDENDKVEFSGLTQIEGDKYAFDSNNAAVTIVATPVVNENVSASFVAGVEGVEGTGAYGDGYAYTYTFTAENGDEVTVTFAEAKFEYDEDGEMFFYVGMEDPDYETLYKAIVTSPEYNAEFVESVKYLARPAATYQMQVPVLATIDLPDIINTVLRIDDIVIGGNVVDIELEDAWLDVGESFTTLTPEELQKQYDTEIQAIKDKLAKIDLSDISLSNAWEKISQLTTISGELTTLIDTIKNNADYLGYHQFGASGLVDENGNAQEILQVIYADSAKRLVDENVTVTLVDDRIETTITGGNLTFEYDEFTDEDIMNALVLTDVDGNVIEGALIKYVDLAGTEVGERTYSVYYEGSWDYKPCTVEFTLTVIKAPSSTSVPNVNVGYGEAYDGAPVITNKHGEVLDIDAIEFIIGLDVSKFDYDNDGIKGLNGKMQLILTDDLQNILAMAGLKDGVEMNINDLISALTNYGLLEQWGVSGEMVDGLKQALDAINGIVEANNLLITIGGEYPENFGAYLHGAVSVDKNYETSVGVGYIVIAPALKEVYLDWNYTDSNGIFTWELLKYVDLGATAYVDPEFTAVDEAATDVMQNLFFGINTDGELVVELHGKHHDLEALEASLGNGAYTQLAFTLDIGNELVYAMPIVRAFVLVPGLADVQLVDAEGNALDTFNFTFDNAPKELYVMVDGELVECEITYTGVQTNLTVLEPTTEAPKHAGAYGALVVYTGTNENGELVAVGVDAAAITIAPAQSALEVTGGSFEHDGQAHGVTVNTNADVTMISGTVNFDAAGDGLGIEDVNGVLNVDFPAWLDKILSVKFANAYEYGVSTKSFLFKLQQHEAAMLEMGITEEIIRSLTNLMNNLPDNVVVYFNDNVAYTEPGVYAFFGIVTDSDYIPSYDTGLVTIGKEDTVVDMMNTTVVYNGQGQFVNVYNPDNNDYVTIIVDRENNIGNIIFEDDLNALVALVEDALGYELPKSINVAELHNAVDKILTAAEWIDKLDSEATTVLTQIRQVLAELPQSGVVYINGEWLPTNVGEYEFYGASYSLKFTTNLTEAVLTIVPAELIVVLDDVTIHQGEEIPELTYTVNGLYGGDVVNVTASVVDNTITAEVEASENYKVTVVDGTLTIEPHTKGEPVVENFVDSSCTTEGSYDSVVYCSFCGVELSRESMTVSVKEHTEGEPEVENYVAPDCENFGHYDSVTYCSVCEKELSRYTVRIPARGHTEGQVVVENETDPDCVTDGSYDNVVYCSVCGDELSRETITVPALGHTAGEVVIENEVAPTFDVPGSYDTVIYCTVCGAEVSRKTVVVPCKIAVAQIGEAKYESIQAAVNAAEDGDTVKVIADHEVACDVNPLVMVAGKDITIDLNGKTVTANVKTNATTKVFETAEGAKLTMTDSDVNGNGRVIANGAGILHYMFRNAGEMVIEGGNYELAGLNGGAMFFSMNNNMTVTGGNFTQTTGGWMFNTNLNSVYVITVSGGTFNRYFIGGNTVTPEENTRGEVVLAEGCCLVYDGDEAGTWTVGTHTEGVPVKENEVPATCTEHGSYELVVYCEVCHKEISRETFPIVAIGHTEGAPVEEMRDTNDDGIKDTLFEVTYCETCGEELSAEVKANYVCWNPATAEYYTDLSDALEAVDGDETETIQMLKDYTEAYMIVAPGTTLDLNGKTVTARFAIGLNDAHIIDSTFTGLLKVEQDNINLSLDNSMLPVWNGSGYTFTQVAFVVSGQGMGLTLDTENDVATLRFVPFFRHAAMLNGVVSDHDVRVVVRATWKNDTGVVTQDFTFSDDQVRRVIDANGGRALVLTFNRYSTVSELTLTAMVVTDCGVELAATSYEVN